MFELICADLTFVIDNFVSCLLLTYSAADEWLCGKEATLEISLTRHPNLKLRRSA